MENMELSSQFTHTRIGTNLVNFTIATSLNMENNDPCGIGKKIIWQLMLELNDKWLIERDFQPNDSF